MVEASSTSVRNMSDCSQYASSELDVPYKALCGSLGSNSDKQVSRIYAGLKEGGFTVDYDGTAYTINVLGS